MGTPKEVTLALKQASDLFNTVVDKTDENDLSEIAYSLIYILVQVVKFDRIANIHKMFGIVATDKDYLATTIKASTFSFPVILSIYDNTILANTTTTMCIMLEAKQA